MSSLWRKDDVLGKFSGLEIIARGGKEVVGICM